MLYFIHEQQTRIIIITSVHDTKLITKSLRYQFQFRTTATYDSLFFFLVIHKNIPSVSLALLLYCYSI